MHDIAELFRGNLWQKKNSRETANNPEKAVIADPKTSAPCRRIGIKSNGVGSGVLIVASGAIIPAADVKF